MGSSSIGRIFDPSPFICMNSSHISRRFDPSPSLVICTLLIIYVEYVIGLSIELYELSHISRRFKTFHHIVIITDSFYIGRRFDLSLLRRVWLAQLV